MPTSSEDLFDSLPEPLRSAVALAYGGPRQEWGQAATCVELALRFVGSLRAALVRALGGDVAEILARFSGRPLTLGGWVELASALGDELAALSIPDEVVPLAGWGRPGTGEWEQLQRFVVARNELAHEKLSVRPAERYERTRQLRALGEGLMASLARLFVALGRLEVGVVADVRTVPSGAEGRLRLFAEATAPTHERIAWVGELPVEELVALWTARGQMHAVALAPFVACDSDETWSGLLVWADLKWSERPAARRIRLFDDLRDKKMSASLGPPRPLASVLVVRLPKTATPSRTNLSTTMANTVEVGTRTHHAVHRPPTRLYSRQWSRRSRRRFVAGLLSAVLAATVIGVILLTPRDDIPRSVPGLAGAGRAVNDPVPVDQAVQPCRVPDLAQVWNFDTTVLGTKAGKESGIGVRGHYTLRVKEVACRLHADLTKTGYTGKYGRKDTDLRDRQVLDVSPGGQSATASFALRQDGANGTAEITMRLARRERLLVGVWRSEGADRERAGYWGSLVGQRAGRAEDVATRCFEECVQAAAVDPHDAGSEAVLMRCAERLGDCDRRGAPFD